MGPDGKDTKGPDEQKKDKNTASKNDVQNGNKDNAKKDEPKPLDPESDFHTLMHSSAITITPLMLQATDYGVVDELDGVIGV